MFQVSQDATQTSYDEALKARDYYDGNQLTDEEKVALRKRGQPEIVINRVRRKIEFLKGLEIRSRTDPKAFPRTPQHEQGADAVTDAIRFVCDATDWDKKRTAVYENMLIEGVGGVEIVHEQKKSGEVKIVINQYPWDMLFYDPYARRADFQDSRYKGVAVWMDIDDMPDEVSESIEAMQAAAADGSQHEDKPANNWYDSGRKRARIVLIWEKRHGAWRYCYFVKGQIIAKGESPYVDEDGESVCPLELQSGHVGRNLERYGYVRDLFSLSDEINKRRSKALHQVSTVRTIMTRGAADPATVRREVSRPDGLIEINDGADSRFEIMENAGMAQGQLALLQEAEREMAQAGANSALSGNTGESTSGRAILARQQGGITEIAAFQDKLHHFTRRVYEQIWLRIRQFWTSERWIRVTDDDRNVKFVGLNRPVTLMDQLSQLPDDQLLAATRQMGLVPNDPRLDMVVEVENPVEEMDVDIVIEEVPDRVSLQGETFEALLKYAQSGAIPPQVLIEADPSLPYRKKEKILKMLTEEHQQTPDQQIEAAQKVADVENTQADTAKKLADAGPQIAGIA